MPFFWNRNIMVKYVSKILWKNLEVYLFQKFTSGRSKYLIFHSIMSDKKHLISFLIATSSRFFKFEVYEIMEQYFRPA